MRCPLSGTLDALFLLSLLLPSFSPELRAQDQSSTSERAIYFATASAELDATAQSLLNELLADQAGYSDLSVRIEAHADDRGSAAYNEDLAHRRAVRVATYLERRGLPAAQVQVASFGESQAKIKVGDAKQRLGDRRVVVRLSRTHWANLCSVTAELGRDRSQSFTFSASEKQVLTGARGGKFLIDPGALVDEAGASYRGTVVATLTECYTMDEMLLAELSTTAQGRLLETGGMLRLTASTPAGRPLALAEGHRVYASIPTQNYDERMRVFYGQNHGESGVPRDWAVSPGRVESSAAAFLPEGSPTSVLDLDAALWTYLQAWKKTNPYPQAPDPVESVRVTALGKEPSPDRKRYRPRGLVAKLFTSSAKRDSTEARLYRESLLRYEKRVAKIAEETRHNATLDEQNRKQQLAYQAQISNWEQRRENYSRTMMGELLRQYAAKSSQDSLRYAQWREQRLAELESAFAENELTDRHQADRYFFEISELGWVNCDVFYRSTAEKTRLLVRNDNPDAQPKITLVLREPRALLSLSRVGDGVLAADNIPVGLATDLIAYKVEAGRLLLAQRSFVTTPDLELELEYRPVAVAELRKVLARYQGS